MSFTIAELITTAVIEDRLDFLSKHPDHINWMLSSLVCNKAMKRLVDARYVDECVKYITTNRINVRPVYESDMAKFPSIVIAAHQGESQQFIGDEGGDAMVREVAPQVLLDFNATQFAGDMIIASDNQGVEETVWPGLYFRSGAFVAKILRVYKVVGTPTLVNVQIDRPIPSGTSVRGCEVITTPNQQWYHFNSSIDDVVVSATLSTAGDHAIHRLMCIVLRYCLKSGRLLFDSYGMQVATFSQQPVTLADDTQMIWQTNFTIQAKATDHWITQDDELVGAPMFNDLTFDKPDE